MVEVDVLGGDTGVAQAVGLTIWARDRDLCEGFRRSLWVITAGGGAVGKRYCAPLSYLALADTLTALRYRFRHLATEPVPQSPRWQQHVRRRTIGVMGRHRWPAQPPPTFGGKRVHGPTVLADLHCVRLQLSEIIAYSIGMQICLALTLTPRARRREPGPVAG